VPFDLSDEAITSGQPVTIQCTVSEGDLPINFRWAFHGQELSSQMGISTLRLNARVSLLSIDSIAAGHAGNYTCTAQNSAGSTNHTATLLVQGLAFFSQKEKRSVSPKLTPSLRARLFIP
jgi:Immunoglobulin domain